MLPLRKPQSGFGLFELAVTLIILAVLSSMLLARIGEYQEQAEEVVVKQLTANMRSSLQVRAAELAGRGDQAALLALEGINPLILLNKFPANYGGEVRREDLPALRKASWYFLPAERTLVYLLNERNFVAIRGQKSLNFKVKLLRVSKDAIPEVTMDSSPSIVLEEE